jgi:hypothetical protein
MNKDFIPCEQALALKELGFDEPCIKYYWTDGMFAKGYEDPFNYNKRDNVISAPTYSQAFRWFREKYGLWQTVLQNTDVDWTYDILPINGIHDYKLIDVFETYEEAELACLIKLFGIVKEK